MALYEVVLQKPDGADEVRFTDHALQPSRPLVIDGGSRWRIVRVEAPAHPLCVCRYLCVRTDDDAA
jgi:hypothetical protein